MATSAARFRASVTLETKCWERDWRTLLAPGLLEERFARLGRTFDQRILSVNNVESVSDVCRAADKLVAEGVLTEYRLVSEAAAEALDHFGLRSSELGEGYWYSVAELIGIHRCPSDFLVHFAGDATMAHVHDWVTPGISRLDDRVLVVNPIWNGKVEEAQRESIELHGDYYLGFGFSDQCFLLSPAVWRMADLTLAHPVSERYPTYGGQLFERRADSWMRSRGLLRATDRRCTYVHPA